MNNSIHSLEMLSQNGWIQLTCFGEFNMPAEREIPLGRWANKHWSSVHACRECTRTKNKKQNKNLFHSSASVTYHWAFFIMIIFLLLPWAQHWSHKRLTTWLCVNISKPHIAVLKCTWSFLTWKGKRESMGSQKTIGRTVLYDFSDQCLTLVSYMITLSFIKFDARLLHNSLVC